MCEEGCTRVDMRVVKHTFATRVVRDVLPLGVEVVFIANAVFMISGVPDLAGCLLTDGEGVATLDELNAAGGALVDSGSDQDVDVIGHYDEAVEFELSLLSVAQECGDEEVGVRCALEVTAALVGEYGDRVGALLLANRGHKERAYPRG